MSTDNTHHSSYTEKFNIINDTYLLTYLLTPWSIVFLEKLTGYIIYNSYLYIIIFI